MNIFFIGHLGLSSQPLNRANSAAGNQVQREIAKEISLHASAKSSTLYAMASQFTWPKGPLFFKTSHDGQIIFPGYINFSGLKNILFAARLLLKLIEVQPDICLQYNSYFWENLSLLFYRFWRPKCSLVMFLQDIHVNLDTPLLTERSLRLMAEKASLRLATRFDLIVAISKEVIDDLCIDQDKGFVFQGGVTDFARILMDDSKREPLLDIAVFAGALEPYNGIDKLVERWIASDIKPQLHIFGSGSLSEDLRAVSRGSCSIVFHDLQPEIVVLEWQRRARWNFCLRYSIGIDQRYFFPSKLFNILLRPGNVFVNDFHGFPNKLRKYVTILSDDLSDLPLQLSLTNQAINFDGVQDRHKIVLDEFRWKACIERIFKYFL